MKSQTVMSIGIMLCIIAIWSASASIWFFKQGDEILVQAKSIHDEAEELNTATIEIYNMDIAQIAQKEKNGQDAIKIDAAANEILKNITDVFDGKYNQAIGDRTSERLLSYIERIKAEEGLTGLEQRYYISVAHKIYEEAYSYGYNDIMEIVLTKVLPKENPGE